MTAALPIPHVRTWRVVWLLGVTQIVGYGTIYYAFAILAPAIAAEFGVEPAWLFAVLSAGLLAGGLAGPYLGRAMDRYGAPLLMAGGSAAVTVLFVLLASAPDFTTYSMLVFALELVSGAVFYSAAFPALTLFGGAGARRSITHLTLIAGFASTLFWPLTGWLEASLGWRTTYFVFAALNLLIAFPAHCLIASWARKGKAQAPPVTAPAATVVPPASASAFWAVSMSFALTAMAASALTVHLVPVLAAADLGATAFAVSMVMGPAQVMIRLMDALFWRALHPLAVATIAATCIPLGILLLLAPVPPLIAGIVFAALFGFGQGLSSIVSGTVPLALFGRQGFGELLGRISLIRLVFSAGAPFALAEALRLFGLTTALTVLMVIALCGIAPLLLLMHRHGWRS